MKPICYFAGLIWVLGLSGCGQDDSATEQKAADAPAPAAEVIETVTVSDAGTIYIDHSRDEMEFELMKSIAGMQSLAEDIKAGGGDASEIEAQIAALEGELAALLQ